MMVLIVVVMRSAVVMMALVVERIVVIVIANHRCGDCRSGDGLKGRWDRHRCRPKSFVGVVRTGKGTPVSTFRGSLALSSRLVRVSSFFREANIGNFRFAFDGFGQREGRSKQLPSATATACFSFAASAFEVIEFFEDIHPLLLLLHHHLRMSFDLNCASVRHKSYEEEE
jgi:hypothetical protein